MENIYLVVGCSTSEGSRLLGKAVHIVEIVPPHHRTYIRGFSESGVDMVYSFVNHDEEDCCIINGNFQVKDHPKGICLIQKKYLMPLDPLEETCDNLEIELVN